MACFAGLDPGLRGGIAILDENGKILATKSMPTNKSNGKQVINFAAVAAFLKEYEPDLCVIEKVSAMPGQGVVSMFSFGFGYGGLVGVVETMGMPYELVRPQVWQKTTIAGIDKKLGKARSVVFCQHHYPEEAITKDGIADAVCMAIVARDRFS